MKTKRIGVCVVGCGYMGTIHAERWNNLPAARVIAVADILPERADHLAKNLGAADWYTDYRTAIDRSDVDVVSICVPTNLHAEVSGFAMQLGKHVLCEKPIALSEDQAQAMIELARNRHVKLGLGFMRRHSSVTNRLRELLASGEFGHPVLYHAMDIRQVRPKLAMHDAHQNGGPAIDMAVHLFDLWSEIFASKPAEISAQGLTLAAGRPELTTIPHLATDTASILIRYCSGDIASFIVSWGLPPGVNPPACPDQIYTPKGLVEVEFGMKHQSLRRMREGGDWEELATSNEDMYQQEISCMARHILDDEPFPTGGESGLAALQIALTVKNLIQRFPSIDPELPG